MYLPVILVLVATTVNCIPIAEEGGTAPQAYTSCRYWCHYNGPYCCDDGSIPLPENHDTHEGLICPPMDQHICKNKNNLTETILLKSEPSVVLAKGNFKTLVCASDGYCQKKEKCCPTECEKRHICMLGLKDSEAEEKQAEEEAALEEEIAIENEEYPAILEDEYEEPPVVA